MYIIRLIVECDLSGFTEHSEKTVPVKFIGKKKNSA